MNKTLRVSLWFLLAFLVSLSVWGGCHARQIRKMHEAQKVAAFDGPMCIPGVNCSK